MSPYCCRERPRRASPARRGLNVANVAGYAVPAAVLAFLPKCPLCITAYLAIGTGLGITVSTAAHLRTLLLVPCVVCLVFMTAKQAVRWMAARQLPHSGERSLPGPCICGQDESLPL